jgi:hypothetical protein
VVERVRAHVIILHLQCLLPIHVDSALEGDRLRQQIGGVELLLALN